MSEAQRFASRNCPKGSLAHHPNFGLVEVIGVNGLEREIKCETVDDDFHPQTIYALIHVSSLRAVDYLRVTDQPLNSHTCKVIPFSLAQKDSLVDDSSRLKEFTMSMITAMYIAFSMLLAFAVLMAWWSVRQKLLEENEKEPLESKNTIAGEQGDQS